MFICNNQKRARVFVIFLKTLFKSQKNIYNVDLNMDIFTGDPQNATRGKNVNKRPHKKSETRDCHSLQLIAIIVI